jgi:hypothetical protein
VPDGSLVPDESSAFVLGLAALGLFS